MRPVLAHLFSLRFSASLSDLSLYLYLTHLLLLHATNTLDIIMTTSTKQKNSKTGTQQYVHVACLRKWQSVAGKRDGDGESESFFFFLLLHLGNVRIAFLLLFCSRECLIEMHFGLGWRE